MNVVVTGSAGLIGSEAVRFYCGQGHHVFGIDNDLRSFFFGPSASTRWQKDALVSRYGLYQHSDIDIRDDQAVNAFFLGLKGKVDLIIHTAAQPSHDWAASDPHVDFSVNATGTLVLLEAFRKYVPDAVFIFTSTNKVYGDNPNNLPLVEKDTRWELPENHHYFDGIDEGMSIDQTKHSIFGVSKTAADLMVQEYGRYFGLKTVVFRGGCLSGAAHSGARLHGFLSYLMKCAYTGDEYVIYGYKGKQVRDNIHSSDVINAFEEFRKSPRVGAVYNLGGGRQSNCSMLEAIKLCEEITGRPMKTKYEEANRIGDHMWWISSMEKFRSHYPKWEIRKKVPGILEEIWGAFSENDLDTAR